MVKAGIILKKRVNPIYILAKLIIAILLMVLLMDTTTNIAENMNGTATNQTIIFESLGFNFGYHDTDECTTLCTDRLNGSTDKTLNNIIGVIGILTIFWIVIDLLKMRW